MENININVTLFNLLDLLFDDTASYEIITFMKLPMMKLSAM